MYINAGLQHLEHFVRIQLCVIMAAMEAVYQVTDLVCTNHWSAAMVPPKNDTGLRDAARLQCASTMLYNMLWMMRPLFLLKKLAFQVSAGLSEGVPLREIPGHTDSDNEKAIEYWAPRWCRNSTIMTIFKKPRTQY